MRIGSIIILIWLIIGAIAAGQRGYYKSNKADDVSCAKAGTIAVTILAGPLNYVGVNPKVTCPKPS
jgi:hypothetical protein